MTPEQAINLLTTMAGNCPATRQDHVNAMQAAQVLRDLLLPEDEE